MDTFGTLVLWTFAAIGFLAVVSSVGVFVMTYRLDDPDPDVAAIVEVHTQPSHVRVVDSLRTLCDVCGDPHDVRQVCPARIAAARGALS